MFRLLRHSRWKGRRQTPLDQFQAVEVNSQNGIIRRQMCLSPGQSSGPFKTRPIQHTIFSGIQPTGKLHLGNYFGAVKLWLDLHNGTHDHQLGGVSKEHVSPQSTNQSVDSLKINKLILSIVDFHAMTLPYDPQEFKTNIRSMMIWLLACGLDPDKAILFRQSDVTQHAELAWILGCFTSMARLERIPTYKEKSSAQHLKWTPLGLYVYPVLQAADILLYQTTLVPVGEDQLQNIQVCQELADRFNDKTGQNVFTRPRALRSKNSLAHRIRSLRDPSKKMSKSDPTPRSTICITDPPDVVLDKCKKALTDFTSAVAYEPETRPGVANLLSIHSLITGETIEDIVKDSASLDTGQYKVRLAKVINEFLKPIQKEISYLGQNLDYVDRVYRIGGEKASQIAAETMAQVKNAAGLSLKT